MPANEGQNGKDGKEEGAAGKDAAEKPPAEHKPKPPKEPKEIKPNADGTYTCKTCVKIFPTEEKLVEHARDHAGERSYECGTCGTPRSCSIPW